MYKIIYFILAWLHHIILLLVQGLGLIVTRLKILIADVFEFLHLNNSCSPLPCSPTEVHKIWRSLDQWLPEQAELPPGGASRAHLAACRTRRPPPVLPPSPFSQTPPPPLRTAGRAAALLYLFPLQSPSLQHQLRAASCCCSCLHVVIVRRLLCRTQLARCCMVTMSPSPRTCCLLIQGTMGGWVQWAKGSNNAFCDKLKGDNTCNFVLVKGK